MTVKQINEQMIERMNEQTNKPLAGEMTDENKFTL